MAAAPARPVAPAVAAERQSLPLDYPFMTLRPPLDDPWRVSIWTNAPVVLFVPVAIGAADKTSLIPGAGKYLVTVSR